MWLLNDNAQTAETASLSPWSMEQQQSRWGGGGGGAEFKERLNYEERMRSIIPPAFRNGNATVVWQDSNKSLEANINEALGITGWSTSTTNGQFAEQEIPSSGSNQYQTPFSNGIASAAWGQNETDQQRPWDVGNLATGPSQTMRSPPMLCGNGTPVKGWPGGDEQQQQQFWGNGMPRPPAVPCGPPPNYGSATAPGAWQQNVPRASIYPPPPARFGGPPFDGCGATGNLCLQRPYHPCLPGTLGMPPPQRSRLQNVWAANAPVNTPVSGLCVPPPNVDYSSASNTMGHWAPPAAGSSLGSGAPKPQFAPHGAYGSRSPPPVTVGTFTSPPNNSGSFMGEDSMWQDPNGEVRKWQRDTGTAIWGDPEKQSKEIHRWLDPSGRELEGVSDSALPKSDDGTAEDTSSSSGRVIIPMGWGDLPPIAPVMKSPNSTSSGVSSGGSTGSWNSKPQTTAPPFNVNWDSRSAAVKPSGGAWDMMGEAPQGWNQPVGLMSPNGSSPDSGMPVATQVIADQLRTAVAKGLIDFSLLSQPLPHQTLSLINTLLRRLPVLDQAEQELASLLHAVKIGAGGEAAAAGGGVGSPVSLMTAEQRAEHDRLVIEIAATKTDIAAIREQIRDTYNSANGIGSGAKGLTALSETVTATMPSFGDSLLDAAAGVSQTKPLFNMF